MARGRKKRTMRDYWTPEELAEWQNRLGFDDHTAAARIGLTSVTYYRRLKDGQAPINQKLAQSAMCVEMVDGIYREIVAGKGQEIRLPEAA